MIYGVKEDLLCEIYEVLFKTLKDYYGAKRDNELDMLDVSVSIILDAVDFRIRDDESKAYTGKFPWKAVAKDVSSAFFQQGLCNQPSNQKLVHGAFEKALHGFSLKFKGKDDGKKKKSKR